MKKLGIVLFLISISLTQFGIAQSEIDKLIAKAQAGDPKAQNQLGVRYLIGDGVEKDPERSGGVVSQSGTTSGTRMRSSIWGRRTLTVQP